MIKIRSSNIMKKFTRQSPDKTAKKVLAVNHASGKNLFLILCNIILVVGMILAVVIYSNTIMRQKNTLKLDAFCTTVESMKQVSENYLSTEKGYVQDWAAYISGRHMTAAEALEYIRLTNTQENRDAHLVDIDDMSARSTYEVNGNPWVHCYDDMVRLDTSDSNFFLNKMRAIFNDGDNKVLVLGKYRVGETQRTVVSVGTRVTIREDDGSDRDYLLLRLIPVEYLQKSWAFPTEFPTAEISMISKDGGYVVSSPSLRSKNFLEFIRGYNFTDNYNQMNVLEEQLASTDTGLLKYKDSRGVDCYFYYSSFGDDSNVDILGYIPVADVQADVVDWSIVVIICGTVFLLIILDGTHILSINHRLRKSYTIAENANLAKTQFLSTMSHDIRTPMNAVIGMTEIAKHHVDDPVYIKNCLDKVSMSGNHLLTLINDILDISKVESGKMTLNPQPISVNGTVKEIASMISQNASEREIKFKLNVHDITHDTVVADALRIRQILINLLTNSVKYTEPTGHILFDVSERPIDDCDDRIELIFVVSDDGIGMSQEFQSTMYNSFSRATDSRINSIQGSGLGLSIVHQMVQLMHGSISCNSSPGTGTTFTVRLAFPIMADTVEETDICDNATTDTANEFTGMRVLIAEDNDLNWEIIHILLDEYGIVSDRAENGQICLDILNSPDSPRYDLILMDVQMPVMNGRDATRHIRSSSDAYISRLPIAAMTADAFAEDVYSCLEAGMDAHISKPIDMKQVIPILRKTQNGTLHRKEENVQ